MIDRRSLRIPLALALVLLAVASVAAAAAPAPQEEPVEEPVPAPEAPSLGIQTQLFQVTMILSRTGAAEKAGRGPVPQAAQRALDDLRDFLPYRSYELLDTALLRTARRAETTMRGLNNREFHVSLEFSKAPPRDAHDLWIQRLRVVDTTIVPGLSMNFDSGKVTRSHEIPAKGPRTIIETSFGMNTGETLVVGSSRLNGGETALVLLLSAVPGQGSSAGR